MRNDTAAGVAPDKLEKLVGRNSDQQNWLMMFDDFRTGKCAGGIEASQNPNRLARVADVAGLEYVAGDFAVLVGSRCPGRALHRPEPFGSERRLQA